MGLDREIIRRRMEQKINNQSNQRGRKRLVKVTKEVLDLTWPTETCCIHRGRGNFSPKTQFGGLLMSILRFSFQNCRKELIFYWSGSFCFSFLVATRKKREVLCARGQRNEEEADELVRKRKRRLGGCCGCWILLPFFPRAKYTKWRKVPKIQTGRKERKRGKRKLIKGLKCTEAKGWPGPTVGPLARSVRGHSWQVVTRAERCPLSPSPHLNNPLFTLDWPSAAKESETWTKQIATGSKYHRRHRHHHYHRSNHLYIKRGKNYSRSLAKLMTLFMLPVESSMSFCDSCGPCDPSKLCGWSPSIISPSK